MDFDADVVRDQAHDPFRVGWCYAAARIFKAARKPVDPEAAIWVEHHFDDAGVFQICRDRRPERGTQHARATSEGFRPKRD